MTSQQMPSPGYTNREISYLLAPLVEMDPDDMTAYVVIAADHEGLRISVPDDMPADQRIDILAHAIIAVGQEMQALIEQRGGEPA